jgi:GTP cyclohydrolase II
MVRYSQARLPTIHGEFHLLVYRTGHPVAVGGTAVGPGPEEHMLLMMGDVTSPDVVTRVHSSCFTGEVIGSLRCDCRAQLDAAMAEIARVGHGVIVYLVQEGRGIGLGNKLKAYALQDAGADTVEANLALGFEADDRSYVLAAAMLRDVGVKSVRLLTNNPSKIKGLMDAGMPVSSQQSLWVGESAHSASYLDVKKQKLGHIK